MARIHPRVSERHPELSEDDVRHAWDNRFAEATRSDVAGYWQVIAIGADQKGRLVEMVASLQGGDWLVFHAFTPPTKKAMDEIFPRGGRENG